MASANAPRGAQDKFFILFDLQSEGLVIPVCLTGCELLFISALGQKSTACEAGHKYALTKMDMKLWINPVFVPKRQKKWIAAIPNPGETKQNRNIWI